MTRQPTCFFARPSQLPGGDELDERLSQVLAGRGIALVSGVALFAPGKPWAMLIDAIERADMVLADVTGPSSNVLYELGMAHASNKRTLIIAQDVEGLPFDISQFQVIVYRPDDVEKLANYVGDWAEAVLTEPAAS